MSRNTRCTVLRITIALAVSALFTMAMPGFERIATVLLTATGISGCVLAYLIEARHVA